MPSREEDQTPARDHAGSEPHSTTPSSGDASSENRPVCERPGK